ncbi:Asp-tRNA(Asn)/Glu-tRNA(Gln) amidotransferase subunit GatB [Cellulosilyticum ruminicola]|uniref:hypothetical protein n=1 Tax=Cellulosilyticum ruminicola TaxID=425254 RepID=UPI00278C3A2E|nr:hypothetical protein [Cellulosilyticum ruminicola]
MPVLIDERLDIYTGKYTLSKADAKILVADKCISDFYDEAVKHYNNYKQVANFVIAELLRYINEGELDSSQIPFSPEAFAKLVKMIEEDVVNRNNGKTILKFMVDGAKDPEEIAKEQGFLMNNNADEIVEVVDGVVNEFTSEVEGYLAGKEKLFGFLMGQCTKRLAGRANPKKIKETLEVALNKLK